MTHAYNRLYIGKSSRAVGNMLHYAVLEFGFDGADFLERFIQSGIAKQIEEGNPKYVAGKSGLELFLDVIEITSSESCDYHTSQIYNFERSDVYWTGWILAQYQWYSNKSFRSILNVVSFDDLLSLYKTLHEADVHKSFEVLNTHFQNNGSNLKNARLRCGLTQKRLADISGVSLNTIRAYEQRTKNINKAQIDTIIRIANVLGCDVTEIID